MCRAIYIKSTTTDLARIVGIKLAIESYERGNKHGFFVATNKKELRTLDFGEYLKFINNMKGDKVLMHLRLATSGKGLERNIHGWKFKILSEKYYCIHNGIIHLTYELNKEMSDSWNFFKNLEYTSNLNEIKEKIETIYERGGGVFLAVNEKFSKLLLININENSYVYEVEFEKPVGKAIIVSSKEDIVKSLIKDEKIEILEKRKKKVWIFEKEKVMKRKIGEYKIRDYDFVKLDEDMVYLIDLKNNKLIDKKSLKLEKTYKYTHYTHYYYYK